MTESDSFDLPLEGFSVRLPRHYVPMFTMDVGSFAHVRLLNDSLAAEYVPQRREVDVRDPKFRPDERVTCKFHTLKQKSRMSFDAVARKNHQLTCETTAPTSEHPPVDEVHGGVGWRLFSIVYTSLRGVCDLRGVEAYRSPDRPDVPILRVFWSGPESIAVEIEREIRQAISSVVRR